ncbi:MAG: cell division protein FtsQ [Flavobacterium sp.]|nr:cell division protein FtsQ [Flavobacterium sp.]
MKKFFNWPTIRLVLMFALVLFLYSFTANRNLNRKLQKTEVIFENNDILFVSPETVNKLLIENKSDVKTIAKVEVDLNKLEKSINKNQMIEKSDVYVTIDGTLRAKVKQKTPIARVFDNSGSFYIDYEGSTMPLSELNSARVPLVWGEITDKNKKKLSEILKMIYDDEFLKKNIIGVQILPKDELLMKNRNYNFDILFGKPINVEKKFNNYKAFFQKEVNDSILNKYKKINLKFTQQVVCIK